jgi:N-acetylmuramoyl-L-alanine amidase
MSKAMILIDKSKRFPICLKDKWDGVPHKVGRDSCRVALSRRDKGQAFPKFFDEKTEPRKIDFLVLHHVSATSADHAVELFKEHQVSSHFLIDEAGKIFELVEENNIAYHAGTSFWRGFDGLNKSSIGIEFINSSPFAKKFEEAQMRSGVELCQYLIAKYQIAAGNVVGHSDIGYDKETGFLDRKQDPSHLFDWKFLAENAVGIFPKIFTGIFTEEEKPKEEKLFGLGNKDAAIGEIKKNLQKFGYRVMNLSDEFDQEMQALARVFNRRFIGQNSDFWHLSSQQILDELLNSMTLLEFLATAARTGLVSSNISPT